MFLQGIECPRCNDGFIKEMGLHLLHHLTEVTETVRSNTIVHEATAPQHPETASNAEIEEEESASIAPEGWKMCVGLLL